MSACAGLPASPLQTWQLQITGWGGGEETNEESSWTIHFLYPHALVLCPRSWEAPLDHHHQQQESLFLYKLCQVHRPAASLHVVSPGSITQPRAGSLPPNPASHPTHSGRKGSRRAAGSVGQHSRRPWLCGYGCQQA